MPDRDRQREGVCRRRRHQGNGREIRRRFLPPGFFRRVAKSCRRGAQAMVCRCGRLRTGRRMRTCDDGGLYHCGRHGEIRTTGNQAGRGAWHGRFTASDTRRGQGQGDGHVPDRQDDGRGGSGKGGSGHPCRARRPAHRRSVQDCRGDRGDAAHGRDDQQGNGQSRLRDDPVPGADYRAATFSDPDGDRGQAGRHAGVRRKACRQWRGR